jgi:pimeloyl-ACP methyl ester carboxylesterase
MLLLAVAACASPAEQFDRQARRLGLSSHRVQGTDFVHALYAKNSRAEQMEGRLDIYLDGDGTPVIAGLPADDPTPRNPLMLRLLALDARPAIYLGRPCYHGRQPPAACSSALWTSARYGEAVVASLAAAVRRFRAGHGFDSLVWFGYSGGGAIAVLLAERFPETEGVVTVAANLDVAAWTHHHRYPALAGSLDPAARPPLQPHIVQRHYVGTTDTVVSRSARTAVSNRTRWIEIAGFDHTCCWEAIWPQILSELDVALDMVRASSAGWSTDRNSGQR